MIYDISDFQSEVLQRSVQIPVLVDFWAEWCAPCKMLGPVLERLAQQSQGRWELAKVDTEQMPEISRAYGIQSIPNVKLFSQGTVIAEFVGALPEQMILQWLEKNLPGKYQNTIEMAKKLLIEENIADARELLEMVIADEPGNIEARLIAAKTYLFESPAKAKELASNIDDPRYSEMIEIISIFTRIVDLILHPEVLPEDLMKQTYIDAIKELHAQRFAEALKKFIDVIRTNRYYDDDGSRKACIAIFKYLGEEHPVTLQYRKEFSRALY